MSKPGWCVVAGFVLTITAFSGFGEGRELKRVTLNGLSLGEFGASQVAVLVATGYSERNFHREGASEWAKFFPPSKVSIQYRSIGSIEGDVLSVNDTIAVSVGQLAISAQHNLSKHMSVATVKDKLLYCQGKVNGDDEGFDLCLWVKDGRISRILLQY